MSHSVSEYEYTLAYLYAMFDLLGDEEQGMGLWLALMDECTEEWRFREGQNLVRLVKGTRLSQYAQGQAQLAIADFYRQQQEWGRALPAYELALNLFQSLGLQTDIAMALNNLGLALQDQRRHEEATGRYREAAAIYRSLADWEGLGHVFANLGGAADECGNWPQAIEFYNQSATALEQAGSRSDLAGIYNNLGVAHENQNLLDDARDWYRRSLDLLDSLDETYSPRAIRLLANLGQLYAKDAEWEQAERCYRVALNICHELEDSFSESTTWNNFGTVCTMRGDHEQAARCYQTSIEINQRLGDRRGEALALSNLGAARADLGDSATAETCYRNSLDISQEVGDPDGVARAFNNLGVLLETQGKGREAVDSYVEAARILAELGEFHREVTALINACSQYDRLGAAESAMQLFDRAWGQANRLAYHDHLAELCAFRANIAFRQSASYPDGYRWSARACTHAAKHGVKALQVDVEHVRNQLALMQNRGQVAEAAAFCRVLITVWEADSLWPACPGFKEELEEVTAGLVDETPGALVEDVSRLEL